jgi:hypothetical protein
MPVQRLKEFLDKNDIKYILISHSRAFTAAATAAITHTPGKEIAKTVAVKIDGQLAMAVVPGSRHLDLVALMEELGVFDVKLVTEDEFKNVFPDCELGAMPPFTDSACTWTTNSRTIRRLLLTRARIANSCACNMRILSAWSIPGCCALPRARSMSAWKKSA